jgi:phosphoribosyl-ATP pyrophosphohydrolase/phosphoribosyl-AMP cyclohydrolase
MSGAARADRGPDPSVSPGGVRFDPESGLVPAVVQEAGTGVVLMVGYMNAEALARTLDSGRVTFWSRSRGRLWEKGETSGHWLELRHVRADCDADALLVEAVAHGPTCHTGRASCFDAASSARDRDRGPAASPSSPSTVELVRVLGRLSDTIAARDRDRPSASYTAKLLDGAPALPARKVAEEAVEVAVAALAEPDRVSEESADLLYHLLVLWRAAGVSARDVAAILAARATGERP